MFKFKRKFYWQKFIWGGEEPIVCQMEKCKAHAKTIEKEKEHYFFVCDKHWRIQKV